MALKFLWLGCMMSHGLVLATCFSIDGSRQDGSWRSAIDDDVAMLQLHMQTGKPVACCPEANVTDHVCILYNGYLIGTTAEDIGTMSPEETRDAIIGIVHKLGQGSVSELQKKSTDELLSLCRGFSPLDACLMRNGWAKPEPTMIDVAPKGIPTMSGKDKRNTVIMALWQKHLGTILELRAKTNDQLVDLCPPAPGFTADDCLLFWNSKEKVASMSDEDKRNFMIIKLHNMGMSNSLADLRGKSTEHLVKLCPTSR